MKNQVKVKTSKADIQHHTYDYPHGTTESFFETNVIQFFEAVKGAKYKIKTSCMRRINPMPLPPMSQVKFNTRYFFVPFIDICPYWNELDQRLPYAFRYGTNSAEFYSSIPTKVPTFTLRKLLYLFSEGLKVYQSTGGIADLNNANNVLENDYLKVIKYGLTTDDDEMTLNNVKCDIILKWFDTGNVYRGLIGFVFTPKGRRVYKLLKQLGYDFVVDANCFFKAYASTTDSQIQFNKDHKDDEFSALPLYAYLKVILSYYENSAFINNTSRMARANSLLHTDVDAYELDVTDLETIFDFSTYMTYERDYFTTGFVNPSNGNTFIDNNESIKIFDNTTNGDNEVSASNRYDGTPTLLNGGGSVEFSQNSLNLLKRLTNFLRRHMIAGGRIVDRMLLEYGVTMEDGYSRRTSYIDTITSVMNITPVLNTTSEQLGDYAGFGTSFYDGNKNPEIVINTSENSGYIIAIDTIIPEIFYSQGISRETKHISKFDFLTPEFDAVGMQSILVSELWNNHNGKYSYKDGENASNLRFAYKPRYSEYKEKIPYLTGDFIVPSVNTDLNGYFTDRKFYLKSYVNNNEIEFALTRDFTQTYGSRNYNKIFYIDNALTDKIYSIFRFHVEIEAPMKQMYDEFRLEDSDGSQEVTMPVGGQTFD